VKGNGGEKRRKMTGLDEWQKKLESSSRQCQEQGDQIGRNFAYFGQPKAQSFDLLFFRGKVLN
jgi:hypothetical protein